MSEETLASRFSTRIHRLEIGTVESPKTIDLLAPVDPDALLDDPVVHERYKVDNYLPYWPIIWPSGLMLARRIWQESVGLPNTTGAKRTIELGCGLGMTGIAAGLKGWDVTFTDYDPEAVEFSAHNARRNGVAAEKVHALHMDWREPVKETFPWVLASDVLYERRLHGLLLHAIEAVLEKGGEAWVSDPQRTSAEDFPVEAVGAGFSVKTINIEGESFSGAKQAGQLYILRRA